MTLSTETNTKEYTANGSTTIFAYDYLILESDHMKVYLDGVLQASGYTIDGVGDAQGGNVTFSVAPTNGVRVSLYREVPMTQVTDYQPYDKFPAETHERALDKLTMINQQIFEITQRAISAPIGSDPDVDYTLPQYEAGKAVAWHVTEKKLTNSADQIDTLLAECQAQVTIAAQQASNSSSSASASASSASAASGSAADAVIAENKANEWAENPEDIEVETGKYSALHWAAKAQTTVDTIFNTPREWSATQVHAKTTFDGVATANIDMATMPTVQLLLDQDLTVNISNWAVWDRSMIIETWIKDGNGPYYISWDANVKGIPLQSTQPHQGQEYVTIFWLWSDGSRVSIVRVADILV